MSEALFGAEYAAQYDAVYATKDYEAECDLVEAVLRRYGEGQPRTLLDLGCGTGGHSLPLARRGYRVVGVDRAEAMLERAREKARAATLGAGAGEVEFQQGDLRTLDLGRTCDAVLMMFAVLGYQEANADVAAAMATVRRHLRPGGLFVFDVWYGPAVLTLRPSERLKIQPTADGKVVRASSGTLDTRHHLCATHINMWRLRGREVVSESEESHQVRYFFPLELEAFLASAGMNLRALCAFGDLDEPASEATWNVLAVGQAV